MVKVTGQSLASQVGKFAGWGKSFSAMHCMHTAKQD